MKIALWKNQISNNLKKAMLLDMEEHLTEEIKNIRQRNESLIKDNIHKLQLIKRLKKTLAKAQNVDIHKIEILK